MSEAPPIADDAAMLQAFLRDRDVACPKCEYNLRNLVGNRCPECGDELVLRVNLSEPRLAAPITGLVGLSAGAGFNWLLLAYIVFISMTRRGWPPQAIMNSIGGGSAVFLIAVIAWLVKWRAIRRLPMQQQLWLAVTCWVIVVADLILFIKSAR